MTNHPNSLNQMQQIVILYLDYLDYLNDTDGFSLSSTNEYSKQEAIIYVAKVFKSFITLNDEEKMILNNEYFYRKKCGWWIGKYAKERFNALLFDSVNKFLRRFYSL